MSMRVCSSCSYLYRVSSLWQQSTLGKQSRQFFTSSIFHDEPSRGIPYTSHLHEAKYAHITNSPLPAYRVMDLKGQVMDTQEDPKLSDSVLKKMFEQMLTLKVMDEQLYKAQRMGITSFYMTNIGEEAVQLGSAAGLDPEDMLYLQYRETGLLMWRGFRIDDFMDQCLSNRFDVSKGRQMPVHYGSKKFNIQFISSPLATQIPQAPGFAYGLKLSGSKTCVCVYFGDGASQEGDAHAGFNFASTLGCPVIFFCRNNAYAISTPVAENCISDGIASRGPGYGMESLRVDGNDILAVYKVTKYARDVAVREQRPVLIEAMTYRIGSHSTSDDQTAYQDMEEVKQWKNLNNPITRLGLYMEGRGLWTQGYQDDLEKAILGAVKTSMKRARAELKPNIDYLFTDVYDKLPLRLEQQKKQLLEHINKYKQHYPLDKHES